MSLVVPQPSPQYDRTVATRTKQLIEAEDIRNRKKGADLELAGERLILRSPNGTRYQVIVSDAGDVSAAPAVVSGNAAALPANACRVYLNVSQTGNPNNAYTKINFDTVDYDADGLADVVTNHRITPKRAGTYLVVVSVDNTGTGITAGAAGVSKNGTRVQGVTLATYSTNETFAQCSALVRMNGTTDYIEGLGGCLGGAANVTFFAGGNSATTMTVERVGP